VLPLREGPVSGRTRNGDGWLPLEDGDPTFDAVAEQLAPEHAPQRHADLSCLTTKQRYVIEMAWGLYDGKEYSFRELGEALGISHVAVLKLHSRALEALRRQGVTS
jgi:DNA-directed RNA polymerase sigma subunit (sigma70/sigma32)